MDFGSILDQWDGLQKKDIQRRGPGRKANAAWMDAGTDAPVESEADRYDPVAEQPRINPQVAWMRLHGLVDKDREEEESETPSERRRRLHHARADAILDLHGLTRDEAHEQLERFFTLAKREGYEKVQIVHGKGNHSEGEAKLKRDVRNFLESCPWAGESGNADAKSGGSGATWVILK